MNITEAPIEPNIAELLPGAAKEGADLVGVSVDDQPAEIIQAINDFLAKPPKKRWFRKVDNWNDRAMPLGALWGMQMVRHFDWEWVGVIQHDFDDLKAIGVFDKKRSLGVYPFHFVYGCVQNGAYPTILLAFNMLSAGEIPAFDERAYQNLMDGVQHIVPPA